MHEIRALHCICCWFYKYVCCLGRLLHDDVSMGGSDNSDDQRSSTGWIADRNQVLSDTRLEEIGWCQGKNTRRCSIHSFNSCMVHAAWRWVSHGRLTSQVSYCIVPIQKRPSTVKHGLRYMQGQEPIPTHKCWLKGALIFRNLQPLEKCRFRQPLISHIYPNPAPYDPYLYYIASHTQCTPMRGTV